VTASLSKKLGAEMLGTFVLVFSGTGAITIEEVTGGAVTHVGIAFTFGLAVLSMIYALGDVSGAHLNPAVTLGFFAARRLPGRQVAPYVAAQCGGGFLASLVLRAIFPTATTLGATAPAGAASQSFVLELVMSFILMLVVLSVSTGAKERGMMAGVAVGAVIGFEALLGGPISGASMNPARSLAPALMAGRLGGLWIYLTAPVAGALLAVPACRLVCLSGCCDRRPEAEARGEGGAP
jgi:aquaporin NIP